LHSEVPGVGVLVGLAVIGRCGGVEEGDHHVAVSVDPPHGGPQWCRYAGIEGMDHPVKKRLYVCVGF
jgi:hypothetical protein